MAKTRRTPAAALDTVIARRVKELKARESKQGDDGADGEAQAERGAQVAKLLSKYLETNEGVKVAPSSWVVAESMDSAGGYLYEIRLLLRKGNFVPLVSAIGAETKGKAEEGAAVWVKSVMGSSLEAGTMPYRWTGRSADGGIRKYDRFVDAATWAKTGKG